MTRVEGQQAEVGDGGALLDDDGIPTIFFDIKTGDGKTQRLLVPYYLFTRFILSLIKIGGHAFSEFAKQGLVEGDGEAITDPLPVEKIDVGAAPGVVLQRVQLKGGLPFYLSLDHSRAKRLIEGLSAMLEKSLDEPPAPH